LVVVPLTSYRGSERRPSFSPDGTRVAFSWNGSDFVHRAIYAKTLDSVDPIRLTKDTNQLDDDPVWAPNGEDIAFIRYLRGPTHAVMIVPSMGGPEREIARATAVGWGVPPHLSWSNDGRYLFWSDREGVTKSSSAVVREDTQTGLRRQITFPAIGEGGDSGIMVSPDGSRLAFARARTLTSEDIYTVPLSVDSLPTHAPERLLSGIEVESLAWTADSRELVFSGLVEHNKGIWRVNVLGDHRIQAVNGIPEPVAPPKPILLETDRGTDLAISREKGYLIYTSANFDNNIWKVPLTGTHRGIATSLISSTRNEFEPDYSPDGRSVTFESDRSGSEEIWMTNAEGKGAIQLTSFGAGLSSVPRWAPDSRRIAFDHLEFDARDTTYSTRARTKF
jgi:Tol biopolymer transport system component